MLATTPTVIPQILESAKAAPGPRARRSAPLAVIIFSMTAVLLLLAFLPDISIILSQPESAPAPVTPQPEVLFVPGGAGSRPAINPPVMAADAPPVVPPRAAEMVTGPTTPEETEQPVTADQTEAAFDAILHRRPEVPEKTNPQRSKPAISAGAPPALVPPAVKEEEIAQSNSTRSTASNSNVREPSIAKTTTEPAATSAPQISAVLKKPVEPAAAPDSGTLPRLIEIEDKPPQSGPGYTESGEWVAKRSDAGATQQDIASIVLPASRSRSAAQKYNGLVVIVNKANSNQITKSGISNIYQDRVTRWPSGDRIVVLNLPLDSGERNRFSDEMLNMSSLDAATERSNRTITNRVRNEIRTLNAKAIVNYVERNENAIGYVPAEMLNESEDIRVVFSIP